jgi:hypothetical protein
MHGFQRRVRHHNCGQPVDSCCGGPAFAASVFGGILFGLTTVVAWKQYGPRLEFTLNFEILPAFSEFVRGGLPFLR